MTPYTTSPDSSRTSTRESRPPTPLARPSERPPERPATAAATPVVVEHPVAQHALTALRHRQTFGPDFRAHCHQLLLVLALEATRSMALQTKVPVAGQGEEARHLAKPIVFLAASRSAMGIAACLREFLPETVFGSVTLDPAGSGDRLEPRLHIFHARSLSEVRVVLFQPIVASGLSATLALSLLRKSGANDVAVVSYITSEQGLARIRTGFPEVPFYTAAIDQGWANQLGPLPGIWNFEERLCV